MSSYKSISELSIFLGTIAADDLILISKNCGAGLSNKYTSTRAAVGNLAGTISSYVEEPLSTKILSSLGQLAFKNPVDLNSESDITAFVRKNSGTIQSPNFNAISSIHWTNGIIDEIGSVDLDDVKAKVTDIDEVGDPIAKIDGQQIYNGLSVEPTTTIGFEIAKINGTSIYSGHNTTQFLNLTSKGDEVIKVVTSSPTGTTSYTLKNGVEITPTNAAGANTQVGSEIFKYNDVPVYNNLSVTSLVSNSRKLGDPIADINGNKIYNGVVLNGLATTGQTIAVINGQEIKNGTTINPNDFKTNITLKDGLVGDTIALVDGTELRNNVNVTNVYNSNTGVKIANIANTDVYAPGTDISAVATSGTKIANVTTASGEKISLYSGEHPHVHITQAEYETLKNSNKLDSNTYYFTEGRSTDTGYDDVGIVYRWLGDKKDNYVYKWFELWPDGWCRLGGCERVARGTNGQATVTFNVPFKDMYYLPHVTPTDMQASYSEPCVPVATGAEPAVGRISNEKMSIQVEAGYGNALNLFWTAEGYYDTTKLTDILKTYTDYSATLIGITNVKSTIAGGNSVVGQIVAYGGIDTPSGWLLCDGTAVSKETYAELYAVIGDKFGTSTDTSKFILPKLTDSRYLLGYVEPGNQYSDGLPNITGWIDTEAGMQTVNGCFDKSNHGDDGGYWGSTSSGRLDCIEFNASKSNSIYGEADSVRPKSLTVRYLICWKATENASGGGVIDGTVLAQSDDLNTTTSISRLTYTIQNDCWVTVRIISGDLTISDSPLYIYAANQVLGLMYDIYARSTERPIVGFPVKANTEISILRLDGANFASTMTFKITEYKLQSLAPQIAMPDWDSSKKIDLLTTIGKTGTYTAVLNGYLYVNAGDVVSFKITINECTVFTSWAGSACSDPNSVIPVSKNDEIKWTLAVIAKVGAPGGYLDFYPCKVIALKDCASYVISTWRSADKLSWCRIYNDGWCEQGGKQVTDAANNRQLITLHLAYIDTNYTITASSCGRDYDNAFGIIGNNTTYPVSNGSFYVHNDLEKGDWVMWETKGYIN